MEETTTNSTSTISPLSYRLLSAQQILTWSMLTFLLFGIIGNLCNCFVFLQKSLRSNSCSFYLLISSIANILALTFAITTSIYAIVQIDPITYSLIYCKLRVYIYHSLLMISRYVIIFACIDRACLSSRRVSIRNFSQIRISRIIGIITTIFWFIGPIHLPILSTIQSGSCIMPGIYNLIFGIYVFIFAGFIPPVLMSMFSLITLRNLHSSRVRVHASHTQTNHLMRQRDIHLTRMLIAQVIVYVLTTTPYPLNTIYQAITISIDKSINREIIESFVYFITGTFLLFINPTVSFYIYISTSKAFRGELKAACRNLWQKCFYKQRNLSTIPNTNLRSVTRTLAQQRTGFHASSAIITRPISGK